MAEEAKRSKFSRFRLQHQDDIRKKIQADRLVAYLQAGVLGGKFLGKDVHLTTEKIAATRILLAKVLPDLSSIEHSGAVTLTHEQQLTMLK